MKKWHPITKNQLQLETDEKHPYLMRIHGRYTSSIFDSYVQSKKGVFN